MATEKIQCCKKMWDRIGSYPCSKPAKIERDGKWYCTVHDPERVKQKEAIRRAKWGVDEARSRLAAVKQRAAADVFKALYAEMIKIEAEIADDPVAMSDPKNLLRVGNVAVAAVDKARLEITTAQAALAQAEERLAEAEGVR